MRDMWEERVSDMHSFNPGPPTRKGGLDLFCETWDERARDTGGDAGVSDMGVCLTDNNKSFNPGPPTHKGGLDLVYCIQSSAAAQSCARVVLLWQAGLLR